MDALAGYGSDDSTSSGGPPPVPRPIAKNNLSDLLGATASDDSEEESHGGTGMDRRVTLTPQRTSPVKKKVKKESPQEASHTSVPLATPILSTEENDYTIYWKIDYLKLPVKGGTLSFDEPVPTVDEWNAKLQDLASTLSSTTATTTTNNNNTNETLCWADHLRAQHEFHNPHFFASVVEHFGVKDSLGSFVDASSSMNDDVLDYERRLFPVTSSEPETTTS